MAFCAKCGTAVNDGVSFCPSCGAPAGAAGGPAATPPYAPYTAPPNTPPYGAPQPPYGAPPNAPYGAPPNQAYAPANSGMQENVAGMLCYLVGWITGIIFLLIDKRPSVRFHAAQSIVVFGTLHVISILLVFLWVGSLYGGGFGLHFIFSSLINLLTFVAWIVLMVMAYQGKQFEVPIAAGIARSIAGKVQ